MEQRPYYEAYDDRYRQIHSRNLQWFSREPSPIVDQVMEKYHVRRDAEILEIGCGEGRDAKALLDRGYHVLATDVSAEAIAFCRKTQPAYMQHYQVLNCLTDTLPGRYDFIYAVAVIHMLVKDADRRGLYRFFRSQLKESGIGLICTMGDGKTERCSDISKAFDLQERIHEQTGTPVCIASTSCRMVTEPTFRRELEENGLQILELDITAIEPDFPQMLYAVVSPAKNFEKKKNNA